MESYFESVFKCDLLTCTRVCWVTCFVTVIKRTRMIDAIIAGSREQVFRHSWVLFSMLQQIFETATSL